MSPRLPRDQIHSHSVLINCSEQTVVAGIINSIFGGYSYQKAFFRRTSAFRIREGNNEVNDAHCKQSAADTDAVKMNLSRRCIQTHCCFIFFKSNLDTSAPRVCFMSWLLKPTLYFTGGSNHEFPIYWILGRVAAASANESEQLKVILINSFHCFLWTRCRHSRMLWLGSTKMDVNMTKILLSGPGI